VKQNGLALQFAPKLCDDSEVVFAAVRQNGHALQYAGCERLTDFDLIAAAIDWAMAKGQEVEAASFLKMATPPLNQDPRLIDRAGLSLIQASEGQKHLPPLVLSVRFSLSRSASNMANDLFLRLKHHEHLARHMYIHHPNVLRKGFCGLMYKPVPKHMDEVPEDDDVSDRKIYGWSRNDDPSWQCSGLCKVTCWKKIRDTKHDCKRDHGSDLLKYGCWRFLYRRHLQRAKDMDGCMVQLQEGDLGRGQQVELEMARDVGVKVVVVRCTTLPVDVVSDLLSVIHDGKDIGSKDGAFHMYRHLFEEM